MMIFIEIFIKGDDRFLMVRFTVGFKDFSQFKISSENISKPKSEYNNILMLSVSDDACFYRFSLKF